MVIIEDTLQKKGEHELKHSCFDEMGVPIIRNRLPFGDYCLPPKISVDTKKNMAEIAQNIGSDHLRFKNECIKAREANCQLIILVENNENVSCLNDVLNWVNPDVVYRPKAITGKRLHKAMQTMSERYGVRFEFCKPEDSAKRIIELLNGA